MRWSTQRSWTPATIRLQVAVEENRSSWVGTGLCCGSLAGFSGAADFGKGLGGVFQVETGFLFNRGILDQEQQIFGRQAYAGFTMKRGPVFNVVSVGRQYGVAFIATAPLDPYSHGGQVFTAWDCGLFGVRFDSSIQDVVTVGHGKIMFSYSPGGVAGSNASGTTTAGGVIYEAKPFIFAGVVAHSQDATRHSLDVYGGGLRYTHKSLSLYSYVFDTLRDPGLRGYRDRERLPQIIPTSLWQTPA